MTPEEAKAVLRETRDVAGWFSPETAALIALLDHVQRVADVRGDLFEIGTYHGKSTVLLGRMLRPGERLGVCDVFGDKEAYVPESPTGYLDAFRDTMRARFADLSFLRVYARPSGELTAEEVGTGVRFFHVDGGHTAAEAWGDLLLADRALAPGGAILMDDVFHVGLPGVTEAAFRFLAERPGRLSPIVLGFDQLVLVRPAGRAIYERALEDAATVEQYFPRLPIDRTTADLFGAKVFVLFPRRMKGPATPRSRLTALAIRRPELHRWIIAPLVRAVRTLVRSGGKD
jgi:hypothetical protein